MQRKNIGFMAFAAASLLTALYFASTAVGGDFGTAERQAVEREIAELTARRDAAASEVERLSNATRRLSDDYLDLDLLDERARAVLGLMRADELVLR